MEPGEEVTAAFVSGVTGIKALKSTMAGTELINNATASLVSCGILLTSGSSVCVIVKMA
jgi:hypothetical protein